jgi:hypothetical protein
MDGEIRTRLPNFLYIGPSKAGSTWLHEVLIRHPQIYLTEAKDLYFFDRYFDRGLPWYAAQFRGASSDHRIVGEVCQEYLSCAEAPQRMRDCLGEDLRLMVTLRDPVQRAFSGYLYMRKHGVFEGTFREALETRPGMLGHSMYGTLLTRYLEYFDRSAIHCAVFDDLVEDPQSFIAEVLCWLGVDPMRLDESMLAARLPASRARSLLLAKLAKGGANWARQRNVTTLIGRVKRSPAVQRVLYQPIDGEGPQLSSDDAQYIRERLTLEMRQVEDIFGVNLLTRWQWPGEAS